MRKSTTAATLLVSATACLVAVSPASASTASDVCLTVDPTPAYEYSNFTGYVFTLSAGRGFRYTEISAEDNVKIGYHGHGAEQPDHEVWVRAEHISC